MAAKKTSTPNEKSTKTTKPRAAKPNVSSNVPKVSNKSDSRPVAECPFPEHLRVDLEAAQTEVLKRLLGPNAPLPVFSTRALEHGLKAAGAAGLRQGFSWNSQMDLAWALGYPKMTFIVDGALETDSKSAILAFYGKSLSDLDTGYWFNKTGSVYQGLVPRRAAFVLLHEIEHGEHPFGLSEKKFLQATEPRDLSFEEVRMMLEKVDEPRWLERIALLLEALAGSSSVANVLCGLLEARASDEGNNGKFRVSITQLLMAMCRRLPPDEVSALRQRGAPDAHARGMNAMAKGWLDSAITDLQWADGVEAEALRSFVEACQEGVGDVPFPRYLYAGGESLIKEQVALFDKYMDGPRAFFSTYSTIRHPLLTGPALLSRAKRDYRDGMTHWFERHADFFRPLLENLREDGQLGSHASDVLKRLG